MRLIISIPLTVPHPPFADPNAAAAYAAFHIRMPGGYFYKKQHEIMDAPNQWQPGRRRKEGDKRFFGAILAIVGGIFLLHTFLPGFWNISFVHLSWPWILVIIGLALGIKTGFRKNFWWIMLFIGGTHIIVPTFFPDIPTHQVVWPGLLIGLGLVMAFGKRSPRRWERADCTPTLTSDTDAVNIDLTFSGRKEIVTSKNFRGGTIRASFAGVELNLAGADSNSPEPMLLDINATCAGVELIVPSHWEVQNEIRPLFGNVEDARVIRTPDAGAERRLLVLRGSVSFGSVELKSY